MQILFMYVKGACATNKYIVNLHMCYIYACIVYLHMDLLLV